MQSATSKKSGFKCPTFAVPVPNKTDVQKDCSSDTITESSKKVVSADVKKPVPSLAGDNLSEVKKQLDPDTSVTTETGNQVPAVDSQVDKTLEKKPKVAKFEAKRSNEVSFQNKIISDKSVKKKIQKKKLETNPGKEHSTKTKGDTEGKKAKKRKIETESDNQVKDASKVDLANTDGQPLDTTQAEEIKEQSVKNSTTKVEKKTLKKNQTLPVRSLTEDEYEDLFTAALETAMSLDLDKWEPKVSSPIRVREPVKKKYGKIVGRKPKPEAEDTAHSEVKKTETEVTAQCEVKEPETEDTAQCEVKEPETNTEPCVPDDKADDTESVKAENDVESENVYEERKEAINDEVVEEDNEERPEMDVQEADVAEPDENGGMSEVQMENETTPAASEIDFDNAPGQASPPPKKKKVIKKKSKLEPKQLPFTSEEVRDKENNQNSANTKTATPMIDKIKKLKALKEEIRKEKQKSGLKKKTKSDSACTATSKKRKNDMETKATGIGNTIKPKSTKNKKKEMLERDLDNDGTWVQCCTCNKWRHLKDVCDPSQIPEIWTCHMNSCELYNSCDKEEEQYDESEHIYTKFTEGSVVWAKMSGYPWWPAMVEQDPDSETHFSVENEKSMQPTHYHVVFFDERVSRTWVRATSVKAYTGNEDTDGVVIMKMKKRGPQNYSKDINTAKRNANRAISCNLKTRIELFGFAARYSGTWNKRNPKEQSPAKDICKEKRKRKRDESNRKTPEELLDTNIIDNVVEDVDNILGDVANLIDSLEDQLDDSDLDESNRKTPEELLDTNIIDNVAENVDNILGDVADLIESLEDQLDDSDLDSDFLAEELVVVEKKKQKKRGQCGDEEETKEKPELSSESESETENSETKKEPIKFDSDIFTTEMEDAESLSDSEVQNVDEKPKDNEDLQEPPEKKQKSTTSGEEVVEQIEIRNENTSTEISDDKPENSLECDTEPVDVCDKTLTELSPQKVTEISLESPDMEVNENHGSSDNNKSDDDFDLCDEENHAVPGSQGHRSKSCSQHSINIGEESDDDFDLQETSMYDNVVDELQKSQERAISPVQRVSYSQGSSDPFDMIEE